MRGGRHKAQARPVGSCDVEGRTVAYLLAASAATLLAFAIHASAAPFDPTLVANATFPTEAFTPFVEAEGFPGVEEVTVRFPMRIDMTVPAGYVATGPTPVDLSATVLPFWLVVAFDPPDPSFPTPAGLFASAETYTQVVEVVAHASRVAPSGTQGNVELTATALRAGDQPLASASTQGLVLARPYARLMADVEDPLLRVERFGATNVSVAIRNQGNALLAAVVQVAHADPGLEARVLDPFPIVFRPNPLMFDPEVGIVPVEVRHRSGSGGEVLLVVTTALPQDGWIVQEQVVRLHVDVAGTAAPDATLPLLALVGVAGVVFLFRRA